MRTRRFDWAGPDETTAEIRNWFEVSAPVVDLAEIERAMAEEGDDALLRLTNQFDATDVPRTELAVGLDEAKEALEGLDPVVREALEVAAANIRQVAEAQLDERETEVDLPQGQTVTVGEIPVASAAIYAPGGRASYPSTVLMGCVTARVAGIERLVLVSPAGPDGNVNRTTLAAAALCGADEIFATGGAQAIFALARGTGSIRPVDVIAGPGNSWVNEAKRRVFGEVGIDSLAGPSDLMVVLDGTTDLELAALDLCAQAEHGSESPLVAVVPSEAVAVELEAQVGDLAEAQATVKDSPLAVVVVHDTAAAIALANSFAPEHLELMDHGSASLAGEITTAGCVFVGEGSATAFGDYAAGSNHVLPTGGTGRFFGPLSPGTFRRRTSKVSLDAAAADALAGHVDALARAEGLPVHGLSALARQTSRKNT